MSFFELPGHGVGERMYHEDFSPLQFSSPGQRVSEWNKGVQINQRAFPRESFDEEVFENPIGVFSFFTSNRHNINVPQVFERFPTESGQKLIVKREKAAEFLDCS